MGRLLCHCVLLLAIFVFLNRGYCLANCLERDLSHNHSCHQKKSDRTDCARSHIQADLPASTHVQPPVAVFHPLVTIILAIVGQSAPVIADDSSPPGNYPASNTILRI